MDKPKLRPIEVFPVEQGGKTLVYIKDPFNLATPIGISPIGYFILTHFDGKHSQVDVQSAYARQFGDVLQGSELQTFIEMLDQHHYLESDRFERHREQVILEFRRLPERAPAHVGGVYKADPSELMAQIDGFFSAVDGPGMPSPVAAGSAPRAIVAPHIDFQRGAPAYAWAYKPLVESAGADLYILLGTSHCGGQTPYILTRKDFSTPFGIVENDKEFIDHLQARCALDLFVDEYLHRGEHSLEFQILFLKYAARKRAELTGVAEKPFKIVPILVSSFHSAMIRKTPPEADATIGGFLRTLRELAERETRKVCFVAGVDLAHVGRQFGDREPITEDFLHWVKQADGELVRRLSALDAPGFFEHIARDQDRRRICGFSPLYSLIHLLDGVEGKTLAYRQAYTPETASAVTFTSVLFE